MRADLLDVVAVYSNPMRWASRLKLHKQFEQHMIDSGVRLTVVECAFGERPYELTDHPTINRVRVRSKSAVWNKENLINIGISRLPEDWNYVCWCDADIAFRKPNWASETVHALQHYDIVQPWSDAYDLGPNDEHIQAHKSFCFQYYHDKPVVASGSGPFWGFSGGPYDYPHTGYAWAATRRAVNLLGGLFDVAGMGAGDHHMALALVGKMEKSLPGKVSASYFRNLKTWEKRAIQHINYNLGFVWGTIEHNFHGRKNQRKYIERWDMFLQNDFDPDTDLKKNSYGVYELCGNKPKLTHQLDQYFRLRNEDTNSLG